MKALLRVPCCNTEEKYSPRTNAGVVNRSLPSISVRKPNNARRKPAI